MGENNRQGKIKQTTAAYSFKENWKVLSTKPVSKKTQITANQSEFLYKKKKPYTTIVHLESQLSFGECPLNPT